MRVLVALACMVILVAAYPPPLNCTKAMNSWWEATAGAKDSMSKLKAAVASLRAVGMKKAINSWLELVEERNLTEILAWRSHAGKKISTSVV